MNPPLTASTWMGMSHLYCALSCATMLWRNAATASNSALNIPGSTSTRENSQSYLFHAVHARIKDARYQLHTGVASEGIGMYSRMYIHGRVAVQQQLVFDDLVYPPQRDSIVSVAYILERISASFHEHTTDKKTESPWHRHARAGRHVKTAYQHNYQLT